MDQERVRRVAGDCHCRAHGAVSFMPSGKNGDRKTLPGHPGRRPVPGHARPLRGARRDGGVRKAKAVRPVVRLETGVVTSVGETGETPAVSASGIAHRSDSRRSGRTFADGRRRIGRTGASTGQRRKDPRDQAIAARLRGEGNVGAGRPERSANAASLAGSRPEHCTSGKKMVLVVDADVRQASPQ